MDSHLTQSDSHSSDTCSVDENEEYNFWHKFEGLAPIPGFLTNVVVVCPEKFDQEPEKTGDVIDRKEEKEFTTEICRFVLQNGVKNVQAVSNFMEHTGPIGKELIGRQPELGAIVSIKANPLRGWNGTDVTVILLFACNGRWQQQRMFELVRDSYVASRIGVIILGNAGVLDNISDPSWNEFVKYLQRGNLVKNHMEIVCRTHNRVNRKISSSVDLRIQSPSGGCNSFCGKMDCGHVCPYPCHPGDPKHASERYLCKEQCLRECHSGHRCKEPCWSDCKDCFYVVTVQYSCEHFMEKETQMFCHQQTMGDLCTVPVEKILDCGHFATVTCSFQVEGSGYKCQQMLGGELSCGHGVTFPCWERIPKFITCKIPVRKTFECGHSVLSICSQLGDKAKCDKVCHARLKCGHRCERPCHGEDPKHENFVCQKLCSKFCERGAHRCSRAGGHACSEPCGPCNEEYDYRFQYCGHTITINCADPDPDENTYYCTRPCQRQHAFCRHPCDKLCGEDCGPCEAMVNKTVLNCPYNHRVLMKCQERQLTKCMQLVVPRARSDCGHVIKVLCFEANDVTPLDLSERCKVPCNARFDGQDECGHKCPGICKDCFQGRLHMRCMEPCGKVLICGHSCTSPCGMICPPCRYECTNYCEHARCAYECGVPCVRDCKEPCTYKCAHSECSRRCFEVCDKQICYEPCPIILECGHSCMGFCGEVCPPYCRVCSPKELVNGIFSGENEVGSDDRFIYLKDCKHCVESDAMEKWINVDSEEILPLRCPICSTRISWIRRYSATMNRNFELINSVRVNIFGKSSEIEDIIQNLIENVDTRILSRKVDAFNTDYVENFLFEVPLPLAAAPKQGADLQSMSLEKAKFLKWIFSEWMDVEEILTEFQAKLSPERFKDFKSFWTFYLVDMAEGRVWPMHPNEVRALTIERERLDHVIELYSRISLHQSERTRDLMASFEATRLFQMADDILLQCIPYSQALKESFHQCLKQLDGVLQCKIDLTERERVQIVRAFGEGAGRWFKCQNGHPYVVTECGGATELGECSECGALIGGQNHVVVENNYLAKEMDGAEVPLYPTALNR